MLRRHWRIIAAIAGLALLGVGQPPKQGAKSEQAQAEPNVPDPSASAATLSEAAKAVEPSDYYQPCRDGQKNDHSDLCAQWSAANAARDAAEWAKWQVWLSLGGVAGLVVTLILTASSTKAATRQARVAEQTLAEIESPFLFVENVILEHPLTREMFEPIDQDGSFCPWINYIVRNHGRSPAIIKEIIGQADVAEQLPEFPNFREVDTHDTDIEVVIPPGGKHTFISLVRTPITLSELGKMRRGDSEGSKTPYNLFFFGRIKYSNSYGDMQTVGFRFRYWVVSQFFRHQEAKNYTYRKREVPTSASKRFLR